MGLFAATIVAGVIPAGAAYTSKLLINAVVRGILIHNTGIPNVVTLHDLDPNLHGGPTFTAVNMIILIALLQLALFAITALLGTIRNITQQLLQNSVAMRIQLMVMEKAASLDLSFYEDPASYDLLRRAQTDSINRPVLMISTAFGLLQTLLTFITMIALLIVREPAARAPCAGVADPRLHRRHALRLARLRHRSLGLATPAADELHGHVGHHRQLRERGQALRSRRLLHRAVSDHRRRATTPASEPRSPGAT